MGINRDSWIKIASYSIAVILILFGGLIYMCYRPMSLAMFNVFGLTESTGWLSFLRGHAPNATGWIIYALPDGLWACSYVILIGCLWNFEFPKYLPVALIIPFIGMASEALQGIGVMPGVFDWIDMLMYFAGGCLGVIYLLIVQKQIIKT